MSSFTRFCTYFGVFFIGNITGASYYHHRTNAMIEAEFAKVHQQYDDWTAAQIKKMEESMERTKRLIEEHERSRR